MEKLKLNKFKFEYEEQNDKIRLFMTYDNEPIYINKFVRKDKTSDIISSINDLFKDMVLMINDK